MGKKKTSHHESICPEWKITKTPEGVTIKTDLTVPPLAELPELLASYVNTEDSDHLNKDSMLDIGAALNLAHDIKDAIESCDRDQKKMEAMAVKAIKVGLLLQRVDARLFQSLVDKGVTKTRNASDAAKKKNAPFRELRDKYQEMVESKMARNLSYNEATECVGASLRVSGRTVRKYTKNPNAR